MIAPGEPLAEAGPAGAAPEASVPAGEQTVRRSAFRHALGGIRGFLGRIPHPPLHSKRGLLVVFFALAGIGSAITVGSVVAIQWTETTDFCGRCHTMGPELKAYEMSPHREVACVECHAEPGVVGWIKAKLNGTRQLIQLVTGTYSTPIPAPDHADLPPTSTTCLKCHDPAPLVAEGGPVRLVLNARYRTDAANTRDTIALVLRPAGFGGSTAPRGVHWHIDSDVEYASSDPRAQTIDLVRVTAKDGTREDFIAVQQVQVSTDARPDVERLLAGERVRRMDCIDCHNRVGHGLPSPGQAVDNSLSAGRIDPALPYIKQEASRVLSVEYPSDAAADQAIEGIRGFYGQQYPLVASEKAGAIDAAIADLETTYRLLDSPAMRVTAATYPNNLGHQTAPGCFRCHDGAHYKVVNGALTDESIPSACSTCHTFPQIGSVESGVLIGQRPVTHDDRLWVFSHRSSVTTADPAGTTCGACHTRTYCENCHNTPAVKVTHNGMIFNHAEVIRNTGPQACAYCHQPAYCAQCHSDNVLPNPFSGGAAGPPPAPSGGAASAAPSP
jgi:nitrate/TMAO reductase-like tetraheme cytochrome c subunit